MLNASVFFSEKHLLKSTGDHFLTSFAFLTSASGKKSTRLQFVIILAYLTAILNNSFSPSHIPIYFPALLLRLLFQEALPTSLTARKALLFLLSVTTSPLLGFNPFHG